MLCFNSANSLWELPTEDLYFLVQNSVFHSISIVRGYLRTEHRRVTKCVLCSFTPSLFHWYVLVHALSTLFTECSDLKKVPYLVLCVSMVWKRSRNSSPLRTPSAKYALNSSKDNFPSSKMVRTNKREENHFNFVCYYIF